MSDDGAVVVIGLARSGSALARALAAEGRRVVVVDRVDSPAVRERAAALPASVEVRLGPHDETVVHGAAMVSPSPGVRWDAPELEEARRLGIPIRSEIGFVFERCRGRIIGITGTNGKTTTTSLVAHILRRGQVPVHLGGNIGAPMADRLHDVHPGDWVVLELSSFQLETVVEPRCAVGCVLNVTPDHLDRHGSVEAYAAIKERVVRFAADAAVLGFDDPLTRAMAVSASAAVRWFGRTLEAEGATEREGEVVSLESGDAVPVMPVRDIPLFGAHNLDNVLAAVAVTRAAGMPPVQIADGVRSFEPVAHRLQTVRDEGGVVWVNDSKATNIDAALKALRAFAERPIIWIGGGQAMGASLSELADAVAAQTRFALLIGESATQLDEALAARGFESRHIAGTLAAAVEVAAARARSGDVVLLSPGFKSFDQFESFEDRGDTFISLVRERAGALRTA